MSRDVLTVGSTMRIPLLYRGEYSQWSERFMNYLEEQTDREAMINSIKNGDQSLLHVTQVSIAISSSTEQPPLKDKSMWSDQEKKIQKIDRLARFLLIQGLPNDIYSLIDSNKTTKYLWDALARHMLGSEYGDQDRKAQNQGDVNDVMGLKKKTVVFTFDPLALIAEKMKKDKDEQVLLVEDHAWMESSSDLDQEINANMVFMAQIKKVLSDSEDSSSSSDDKIAENQRDANDAMGSKKKTVMVTSDPLALIAEKTNAFNRRKFYSKPTNNNLRTSSTSQSANKKQEFVKSDNKRVEKKDDEKKRDMSRVKCYNCKKEGHFAKDCKKAKVKDYEYYKTKMLLAKKDKDEQVLLAEDQAWMESGKSESESEFKTSEYYDNSTDYGLFVKNDDDQEIFHNAIDSASENFVENHIDSQKDYDKSDVDHNDSEEKDQLVDKLIRKFNKKIVKCQKRVEKSNQQSKEFENQNKDLQDKYDVLKNQTTTFEMNNKDLNEQLKELIEKNDDLLAQTKLLQEQLQVKHVVI
nr:hypothetical protein [Tanacetum cinerariifolium]